jgi:hypothetical protein
MIRLFTQNKGKTRICEDSLTASVFGVLQYLPSDTFWRILKNSLLENKLPYVAGEIKDIQFWPSWNPEGSKNIIRVEPDVLIRFHEIDVILEAKRYDANQQSIHQLNNQIIGYFNMYNEENKKLYYIQIGGLHSLQDEQNYQRNKNSVPICKTDWTRILAEVSREAEKINVTDFPSLSSSQRILADVISAFAIHQYYKLSWLEKITAPAIETTSLKTYFEYGKH